MRHFNKTLRKSYTNVITLCIRYCGSLLVLASILCLACGNPIVRESDASTLTPVITPDDALSKAKDLFKGRSDLDKAREAIKLLGKARNPEERDFIVEWKFARYSYFLGNRDEISDAERAKVLKKGLLAAKIASRLQTARPEGHFWYGALLGEQAKRSPFTIGLLSLDKIRSALKKSIDIDPGYQNASGYVGLAQLELSTLGLPGGDADKAVDYLETALKLEKRNGFIYLRLAEAYLAVKRKADAKKQLDILLSMKASPDYIPEHAQAVKKGKRILKLKF